VSRSRIYARNLAANWISYGVNMVVMFLLTPFVVHRLGKSAYGVWSLVISLTGYLGLVDIGIRAGVGRFINFHLGRQETDKVNATLSTASGCFAVAGVLITLAAAVMAVFFATLFARVPAEYVPGARAAIMLVSLTIVLMLFGATFGQIVCAFDRFDMARGITVAALVLRAGGTVAVLTAGGGLAALAGVIFGVTVFGVAANYVFARRVFPQLRIRPSLVSRERFRELFGFSVWAAMGRLASQLLYYTDNVVIAILLGPALVTLYSIPLMLVQTARSFLQQISSVLRPQTIKASSVGDHRELRYLFSWGSKVIMFVGIPLFVGLIFFGEEFMRLWIGTEGDWRSEDFTMSGLVLVILVIPQFFVLATRSAADVISGLGYVRFSAVVTFAQGLVNLGLTLVFVMVFGLGLYGVALGTLVPMVVFNAVVVGYVLRWIRMGWRAYVRNSVVRWAAAGGLFAALCYATTLIPLPMWWSAFVGKVVVLAAAALVVCWWVTFSSAEREQLGKRVRGLFSRSAPQSTTRADG
jgi:O-antigen/teichoic acid export membrane protein